MKVAFKYKKVKAKSWGIKGHYQAKRFPKKPISLSCFLAVSENGVVGFQMTSGTNTQIEYSHFLRSLRRTLGRQRITLIADNASIHRSSLSQSIAKSAFFQIFTPPYCPEFNPCEQTFRSIKRFLVDKQLNNREELAHCLLKKIRKINKSEIQKYYLECLEEIDKFFTKQ